MSRRVIVVGGGIAGLTAAYRMSTGDGALQVTLVEASGRLGGKIVTDCIDGFTIEGGPDSFLTSKPGALGLCRELGLLDRLENTTDHPHRAFVERNGRLFPLPEGLTGLVPTQLAPILRSSLLSARGKLRMGLDLIRPPARAREVADESVGSFTRRRLGPEAYHWLVEPLMGGIYGGDGDDLSLAATFPAMREAEQRYGSLIRGMIKMRERAQPALNGDGSRRSAFVAPAGGMGEIVQALAARLTAVDCQVDAPVESVRRTGGGYAISLEDERVMDAEAVVLATPAWATAHLLSGFDRDLAGLLGQITFAPCASLSVAYRATAVRRALDAHGYVVPRSEGRSLVACTWVSSKFTQRAPEGTVLLRAFLGRGAAGAAAAAGADEPLVDQSDAQLLDLATRELRDVLGVEGEPLMYRVYRWPRAMPQYTVGHLDRLRRMEDRLTRYPGLVLAGNSYYGVGLPDTIASAERAAAAIEEHFERVIPARRSTVRPASGPSNGGTRAGAR